MLDILDNLNQKQRNTLKQFRLNLQDLLTTEDTDYVLVKFLRAKSFDLKEAVRIFKENHYSRILYGVNTILDTYKKTEIISRSEGTGALGFAKDGSLIRYIAAGRLDLYGIFMSISYNDLCLYFAYLIESDRKLLKDQSLKTGNDVQEITYIVDFEGFTLHQIFHKNVIEMGLDLVRLVQDYYPDIWNHILYINVPKIFDIFFNLLKPVLRMAVLERSYIADKGSSKDLLLKYIDEDVLPAFLGGSRVDSNGDPNCKEFISFGGTVPEKFYFQNCKMSLSLSDPHVKCMTVRSRSMGNMSFVAREANTKLRFQVKSESGSIYLAMLYREFGTDSTDIALPEEDEYLDETADNFKYKKVSVEIRAQTHCIQEDSTVILKWPGIYVLRFNNSSSWFTSRKILFKYELFPPSKEAK